MTREDIVIEARSWIGTRWMHGQAVKGRGADCVQWIAALGRQIGLIPDDYVTIRYTRDWALHNDTSVLIGEMSHFCVPISLLEIEPGDILVFKQGRCASHAAVYIGNETMIHAHMRHGVIEAPVNTMRTQLDSAWRWKWLVSAKP
jgi:NlpC/P60 family putative phage cell wall peptidase